MRHLKAGWKLGRNTAHRRALLRNLVTSIFLEERIETTVAKAKAMRPHVEKMITLGKRGDLWARRQAGSFLMTQDAVRKLWEIAPRFGDREGGYLRIVRAAFQRGDGAEKAFVELVRKQTDAEKVLIVSDSFDDKTYKSARNVKPVKLATAAEVNTEQLLAFHKILVTSKALEKLAERIQ